LRAANETSVALHISQDGVSRIETRSDFLLSTLRSYVEAMGGKLRLVAEFPDRRPVTISGLNILGTAEKPTRRGPQAGGRGRACLMGPNIAGMTGLPCKRTSTVP
jgi:hypothetical protein